MDIESWKRSNNIHSMMSHVHSKRKNQLFFINCCREGWDILPDEYKNVIVAKEQYIDGLVSLEFVDSEYLIAQRFRTNNQYSDYAFLIIFAISHNCCNIRNVTDYGVSSAKQCIILRDIYNPFLPSINYLWLNHDVVSMAKLIYESQDYKDFPILGDALEDAGCDNDEILHHCRNTVLHYRGNWLIDILRNGVTVEMRFPKKN